MAQYRMSFERREEGFPGDVRYRPIRAEFEASSDEEALRMAQEIVKEEREPHLHYTLEEFRRVEIPAIKVAA